MTALTDRERELLEHLEDDHGMDSNVIEYADVAELESIHDNEHQGG